MFRFIRQHCIGFLALFVALGGTAYAANTVRSIDIVDGQVKTQDLANFSVTPSKLNTVHSNTQHTQPTHECDTPGVWTACAQVSVRVPAGHSYFFIVHSTIHGDAGGSNNVHTLMCAAYAGPTCISDQPDWVTFYKGGVTHGSDTKYYVVNVPAGTDKYVQFSTAVKFSTALYPDSGAHTTTLVEFWDA